MKNIIKLSFLAAVMVAVVGTLSCSHKEVDTNQLSGPIALAAVSPNPVVRGAELHLYGTNMDKVTEVRIPGVAPITAITQGQGNGRLSEIVVTVPLEGPEVGKVVVADANGNTSATKFDLEYAEGMEFEDFECDDVLMPGDVITLKGEYLNNIQEVIFTSGNGLTYATGAMIFDKTRHSTKVYVPAAATSGIIRICDVDETVDKSSIPNIYPSTKEIVVGKPSVDVTEFTEPVKAGTVLTFTGNYLNMVAKVAFSGVEQKDFSVSDDASELSAALPADAEDGDVVFTTFAGDTFVAGTIAGVLPSGLSISVDEESEDPRYKAGYRTFITGEDLDLITGVSFGGVEASFTYNAEDVPPAVIAIIPEEAPDGDVTVQLANGSAVVVDKIEFVNPAVEKVSTDKIVAREKFEFTGEDLELIKKVSVGGIECKFTLDTLEVRDGFDEEGDPIKIAVLDSNKVVVTTDPTILSGDVVIEKLNGWNTVISQMEVTYDEPVDMVLPKEVSLGKKFTITGTNLFMVESMFIKGKKVVDWVSRTDTELVFMIPEGVGPGVYRLDLVLNTGMKLTWAIPFSVTAPYTETFIWEGKHDLADWGNNLEAGPEDGWVQLGIKEGDVVRVYYETYAEEWEFKLQAGHWDSINLEALGGKNTVKPEFADSGDTFYAFEVTADILNQLTATGQGWGFSFVVNGKGAFIKGISLIQFGATETIVWEGSEESGEKCSVNLTLGDETDWVKAGLSEGSEVRIYFTAEDASDWKIQLFSGHWDNMGYVCPSDGQWNQTNSAEAVAKGYVSFEATGDAFTHLTTQAGWGTAFILQGHKVTFTKVVFL